MTKEKKIIIILTSIIVMAFLVVVAISIINSPKNKAIRYIENDLNLSHTELREVKINKNDKNYSYYSKYKYIYMFDTPSATYYVCWNKQQQKWEVFGRG